MRELPGVYVLVVPRQKLPAVSVVVQKLVCMPGSEPGRTNWLVSSSETKPPRALMLMPMQT
ncbi:hypothetical protein NYE70_15030 [Paenibacillus sp. FSL R5-0407]|uniref:Uncharacterized protein n=1 Tax=Paenibacillus vini TaxID=1476024 RepID=A0ABQ4M6N9_9BACL|nr:hypothetical protein J42TS3_06720 [Paenibacillus vini]